MLARQIILPRPLPTKLTPLRPYSCSLLVAPKKVNSFGIKQIQPLFAKHPGCGVPLAAGFRVLCLASPRSITPFKINTSKSATKQTTLTISRINTYAKTGGGYPHHLPTFRHFPNQEFLCALCVGAGPDSVGVANSFETFRRFDIPTFAPFSATMGGLRAQGHNRGTDETASD